MDQKKKALGRGLEQLFDSEVLDFNSFESSILDSANESDIKEIPLSEIRSNPYQPRKTFNDETLRELAESIKNYGVFQPIIVKKSIKGYDLIAGERRVRASKLAGLEKIPAIIKDFSDELMREIALLENLQRENLTAIELAWAYKGIIDSLHITQDELASKLGKSRSSITNILGLLNLPTSVQNMVLDGKLSMGHARELSKLDDTEKVREYAKKIVDENLSVRDIEELSKTSDIKRKNPITRTNKNNDNEYYYIEKELREHFGTKVKVSGKKIEIIFSDNDDLDRLLDIMNIKIN
jgi:ParB family chromosome partitioning protein